MKGPIDLEAEAAIQENIQDNISGKWVYGMMDK